MRCVKKPILFTRLYASDELAIKEAGECGDCTLRANRRVNPVKTVAVVWSGEPER
jgi:hypothetical protein